MLLFLGLFALIPIFVKKVFASKFKTAEIDKDK
jgi:hypothetical protein